MTSHSPFPRFLTVRQVCAIVQRKPRTVYRWIKQGDLPGTLRVKDGYLIPHSALQHVIQPVDDDEHGYSPEPARDASASV